MFDTGCRLLHYYIFTAHMLFDTVGRLSLRLVGRLYTFKQYIIINLEAGRRAHHDKDVSLGSVVELVYDLLGGRDFGF